MNIGIDIDNTITSTRELILDYVYVFDRENNLGTRVDLDYYSLEESLRWDKEVLKRFLSTHLTDIYRRVTAKPYALEVINALHRSHSIILITSRNQRDEAIKAATLEWLSRNQVEYDKLVMNNTADMYHFSKLEACRTNNIDLMIEDHHDLALELSRAIPVLMFDYPYNSHLDVHNVTRVKNWLEVKNIIAGMVALD